MRCSARPAARQKGPFLPAHFVFLRSRKSRFLSEFPPPTHPELAAAWRRKTLVPLGEVSLRRGEGWVKKEAINPESWTWADLGRQKLLFFLLNKIRDMGS